MSDALPRITVVTPSYNQGKFLEQTILSVLHQGYPNLEYLIMDGGSTDDSVQIINKYADRLTYWQSKTDGGQAAAINAGFSMSTGEIMCWLNSDDMFMPGTLLKIGRLFQNFSNPTIAFGNCLHFDETPPKTRGSDVVRNHKSMDIWLCDYLIQPSTFWNRGTWERAGKLDETLHYTFDWDWFIRSNLARVNFVPVPEYLSLYRIHEAHKSHSGGSKRKVELSEIYRKYNTEKEMKAFLRLYRYINNSKFFKNVVYASDKFDLVVFHRIIKFFFSPNISFRTYNQIIKMV